MSANDPKRTLAALQSEALLTRPTSAYGSLHTFEADHLEKRDPRGADNKRWKHSELDYGA